MKHLTSEQIRAIVAAAQSTPSGDNCQPWSFEYAAPTLHIQHDTTRALHRLNPQNVSSLLALGCVFEAIQLAASQFKFRTKEEFVYEAGEIKARVDFVWDETVHDEPLRLAIFNRTTDRRLYHGGSLEDPIMKALDSLSGTFGTAQIHISNNYSKALWQHLALSDGFMFDDAAIFNDILSCIRFSKTEAQATRDGLHYANLGMSLPEAFISRAMSKYPLLFKIMKSLGAAQNVVAMTRRQVKSSAALVLITVENSGPSSVVDGGRLAYRSWLMLNHAGYGVQPLTLSSLGLFQTLYYDSKLETQPARLAQFQLGTEVFKEVFQLDSKAIPLWLFRTGISTPLPASLKTLRRPIEDVFVEFSSMS